MHWFRKCCIYQYAINLDILAVSAVNCDTWSGSERNKVTAIKYTGNDHLVRVCETPATQTQIVILFRTHASKLRNAWYVLKLWWRISSHTLYPEDLTCRPLLVSVDFMRIKKPRSGGSSAGEWGLDGAAGDEKITLAVSRIFLFDFCLNNAIWAQWIVENHIMYLLYFLLLSCHDSTGFRGTS